MLIDGMQLTEGSVLQNLTIASGTSFPANASLSELFYRTDADNKGLYVYTDSWRKLSLAAEAAQSLADMSANLTQAMSALNASVEALAQQDLVQPYDVATFFAGKPATVAKIILYKTATAFEVADSFAGSIASAGTAATATTTFLIKKNGTQINTITFAPASTTGIFGNSSPVTFAAGDTISIEAPITPDASLADLLFTIKGTAS